MGTRTGVRWAGSVGTWHDPSLDRPMAAPLERCAELLGVDLVSLLEAAARVEPYIRADGTRVWSLMQLERQLRPEAYRRRRGGYLDRRQIPAAGTCQRQEAGEGARLLLRTCLSGFCPGACFPWIALATWETTCRWRPLRTARLRWHVDQTWTNRGCRAIGRDWIRGSCG